MGAINCTALPQCCLLSHRAACRGAAFWGQHLKSTGCPVACVCACAPHIAAEAPTSPSPSTPAKPAAAAPHLLSKSTHLGALVLLDAADLLGAVLALLELLARPLDLLGQALAAFAKRRGE
jgi:hypothetical protein